MIYAQNARKITKAMRSSLNLPSWTATVLSRNAGTERGPSGPTAQTALALVDAHKDSVGARIPADAATDPIIATAAAVTKDAAEDLPGRPPCHLSSPTWM
mmetsp:Transcript_22747/g.52625  ORF Transcript_22747/g.52625 Transcript_22747/m.52625 type:complete len:100 (+) Transcript_22747:920-1219(+)